MRGLRHILAATGLAAAVALAGGAAQAAKFKVLASFGFKLGTNPMGPVLMDSAGNLFGTASTGGPRAGGTVYELKRKAGGYKPVSLFHFCLSCGSGQQPNGPAIIDTQGNLYGTADNVVFELSPVIGQKQWAEKILYHFCSQQNCTDGNFPLGGLTYYGASSGEPYDGTSPLYGVTQLGGTNSGGTVFQLTNSSGTWTESVLYNFCSQGGDACTDGKNPLGGLFVNLSGNLFGTTYLGGGKTDGGTAFQLSPKGENWSYTLLYTFCTLAGCADGANPDEPFVPDAKGDLLSTTSDGGAQCHFSGNNCGTIFELSLVDEVWQETVLHSFCQQKDCKDGAAPAGLFVDGTGNIFGTTGLGGGYDTSDAPLGGGTVFELSGPSFKILHRFCSADQCADGYAPGAGVIAGGAGTLFGTTAYGGATGGGTVFKLKP